MHNAEIQERSTDNEELPPLMRFLGTVQEKNRERPLCFPYSVKARILLLCHFQRVNLDANTLGADQACVLKKCPYLINEMINICAHLVGMAMSGRVQQPPRLETIENLMKLSQMIVQALDEKASPIQQLPHITPDMLRYFFTRKRNIRHIRDFVGMKEEERRLMLRSLGDEEYRNIMTVVGTMPYVEMTIKSEVLDEEDSTITVGSIVTVTVNLQRQDMSVLFDSGVLEAVEEEEPAANDQEEAEEEEEHGHDDKGASAAGENKLRVWEKQKKGKKKGGKGKKKVKLPYQWKAAAQAKKDAAAAAKASGEPGTKASPDAGSKNKNAVGAAAASAAGTDEAEDDEQATESGEDNNGSDEEQEESMAGDAASEEKAERTKTGDGEEDEDDDWDTFKMESKKENSLETKKKESHNVHCPFFPAEKQEAWWLYVADKKRHLLITAPVHICSLKTVEEIKLKFSAPPKKGVYHYTVILRSDSYYGDFDQQQNIKLDVKEAKIIKDHPQWDISDDEENKANDGDETEDDEDSDDSTEDDDSN